MHPEIRSGSTTESDVADPTMNDVRRSRQEVLTRFSDRSIGILISDVSENHVFVNHSQKVSYYEAI